MKFNDFTHQAGLLPGGANQWQTIYATVGDDGTSNYIASIWSVEAMAGSITPVTRGDLNTWFGQNQNISTRFIYYKYIDLRFNMACNNSVNCQYDIGRIVIVKQKNLDVPEGGSTPAAVRTYFNAACPYTGTPVNTMDWHVLYDKPFSFGGGGTNNANPGNTSVNTIPKVYRFIIPFKELFHIDPTWTANPPQVGFVPDKGCYVMFQTTNANVYAVNISARVYWKPGT